MRSTIIFLGSFCGAGLVLAACSGDEGQPTNGTSSGTTTPTPAEDAGAQEEAAAPTKKKNAEDCTKNEDCESNICFIGGQGGGGDNQKFCSVACTPSTAAAVCVAPFSGTCNGRGFCKRD